MPYSIGIALDLHAWSARLEVVLRMSSSASGFFFCGMRLEPVVCASLSVTKPNSALAQRITSSLKRER